MCKQSHQQYIFLLASLCIQPHLDACWSFPQSARSVVALAGWILAGGYYWLAAANISSCFAPRVVTFLCGACMCVSRTLYKQ